MLKDLNQTWNLDVFFPGGSASPEFAAFLDQLTADTKALADEVAAGPVSGLAAWVARIDKFQNVASRLRQAGAFVSCLSAQNVNDKHARIVGSRVNQIRAAFASAFTLLDQQMLAVSDADWQAMLASPELKPVAWNLDERRRRAKLQLPSEQEMLVNDLSVTGYQGWSELYDLTVGKMSVTVEKNGQPVKLSMGQAQNRMADADAKFRARIMEAWEKAWTDVSDYCALALNNLSGYRLALYNKRGWDDYLQEPFEYNRVSAETINAMWTAIDQNKDRLVKFLERKKQLLGVEKLGWQDVNAPIGTAESKMTYDEAANFIVEQFRRFSPKMADFAVHAFESRWLEAEDRPGKRMGGFCTSFPLAKESRVFVTFSGTMGNTATVAHELGHGYHQSVVNDLPGLSQNYAMVVAETASTFAEMVVADAAVANAKSEQERIVLMEDKLQRAVQLLMNIQCRYLFETRFYAERKKGVVPVARLNELMLQAQKDAYAGALDEYHPTFWASKLHFYNTGVPFYNFPYTFGFLFCSGVYAKALEVGPSFEDKYRDLLRDTGRMRVEDLAKRHLDADLTKTEFWQKAIDIALSDYDEFMRLTAK
jgi:pepF/M3 family oligoendopeptidase